MDASQVQSWMQDVRPDSSGALQAFEEVPLTPLHNQDTSGGFSHEPLEHEIVASKSVWDVSIIPDELIEQQTGFSMRSSPGMSPTAFASTPRKCSLDAVVDQANSAVEASTDPGVDNAIPTLGMVESSSDLTDESTLGTASTLTLVERPVALDKISGPTIACKDLYISESLRDQIGNLSSIKNDISDELRKSSEAGNKPQSPADLSIPIPSARVLAHSNLPRVEKPATPVSIPKFFEIPIPIFPFPAGTTRCKNRNCPIRSPHEQGPYLHGGKLCTREGSIFGSSNPPPEIWFLYDRWGNGDFQGVDNKPFAAVELFVEFHFGETKGECVTGLNEVRRSVAGQGTRQGGTKSRSWRFWRYGN